MENNDEEDSLDQIVKPKPVFLLLLDGWGVAAKSEANAISLAKMPNFSKFVKEYPATILKAESREINNRYFNIGSGLFGQNDNLNVKSNNDITALIAMAGLKQLKIFESDRMVALTYYFNGYREDKINGEDWLTISSEDGEGSLDAQLSLKKAMKESIRAIRSESYNFLVLACPVLDAVASTGDLLATAKISEVLDKEIRRLALEVMDKKGVLIISSAGGNAERMINMSTDLPDKEITNNPVPFLIIGNDLKGMTIGLDDAPEGDLSLLEPAGSLANIAPTILDLLEISNDNAQFEKSLIKI